MIITISLIVAIIIIFRGIVYPLCHLHVIWICDCDCDLDLPFGYEWGAHEFVVVWCAGVKKRKSS